jgi:hypothetical protein
MGKDKYHPCVLAPQTCKMTELSLRVHDNCIMLGMTMAVPCSDADDSTTSPAQAAQPQTSTPHGFLATAACLGPNRAHLAHGFGVASLVAHDVACGEAECTDKDDNASADNPGEQCRADLLDQSALLARLLPVSAATPCAGDGGAGLALRLVGWTAACGARG